MSAPAAWQVALSAYRPARGLPWSAPRPDAASAAADTWQTALSPATHALLRDSTRVAHTTVPRALVACVADLVCRYSGDTTAAILVRGEGEDVVPLLVPTDPDATLANAIDSVQQAEDTLAGELPLAARALHDGLDDGLLALHVEHGRTVSPLADGARVQVSLIEGVDGTGLVVTADARWVATSDLERFAQRLALLVGIALADETRCLDDISLLTEPERQALEANPDGTPLPFDRERSISAALRDIADAHGEAIAIDDGTRQLSYRSLVREATRARQVLAAQGLRRGRIGILMERSVEQIVALAAVLESGSVYVPMDIAQPPMRLRRIVELADIRTIVTTASQLREVEAWCAELSPRPTVVVMPDTVPGHETALAPLPPEASVGGERPAYVIFTSGSTGEPKGVEVPHRGVLRLVHGSSMMALVPGERVLCNAPPTFDVSVYEIWGALLNGATLVLAPTGLTAIDTLGQFIVSQRITAITIVTALFQELVEYQIERLAGVRQLLVGGEAMPVGHALRLVHRYPAIRLMNGYGPTENTTATSFHLVQGDEDPGEPMPIGRPLENTSVFIVDRNQRLVGPGLVGELCTGGDGVAIGYVGRSDLTAERFVSLTMSGGRTVRVYRTGDRARMRRDGVLEFLGRADGQVKLRGYRIELGEIDAVLTEAPGVRAAAVAITGTGAGQRLRAGLVVGQDAAPDLRNEVRAYAESRLPAYMVPSEFVIIASVPKTVHGKIDRRAIAALPMAAQPGQAAAAPPGARPAPRDAALAPMEDTLSTLWSGVLDLEAPDRDAAFFDLGGNSLLALRLVEAIRRTLQIDLPVVRVFEFPTIATLARFLAHGAATPPTRDAALGTRPSRTGDRIAIIGMAGRFPGAASVSDLWRLLHEEREGIRHFAPAEIDSRITERDDPAYVRARGVLDDVEGFDAAFFGMSPRVAEITDPQQRLLLELAWQAFEDAGIVPGDGDAHTGVFAGVSHNGYLEQHVRAHPELEASVGSLAIIFANDKDYAAAHIAHRLDLRGPAVAVQTSSSTSLTAIAMAVQALRAGQCDLALAGGASITVPVNSGHRYEDGAIYSRDGHTRTFDAAASGTVFSDGGAMVLLQRLEDAQREGRRIDAVICGVGMTNDGAARASFSAPSVRGQEACVTRALDDAGWDPASIGYVEAHGTATPLGDPIEVEALTRAFAARTDRRRFCWLGSLKSNIGHLTAAAGAAGVIKVALAMRHRWIPATLNFHTPNPAIDFDRSPFLVPRRGVAWDATDGARRAGVSSFGVGGTNVHLLLEEPPQTPTARTPEDQAHPHLFVLSARTPAALRARCAALATALDDDALSLDAIATTLRTGRKAFACRTVVVAATRAALREQLLARATDTRDVAAADTPTRRLLLFPGQGAQTPGAGAALYDTLPAFRDAIDRVTAAMGPLRGRPLTDWLFADDTQIPGVSTLLRETDLAQPVLFALGYALADVVLAAGIEPTAMVGHSIGEYAAACHAGVMSLSDAARVVRERGRLMAAMAPGAMLAIRAPVADIEPRLPASVAVAAVNAPRLCVVAGPLDAIEVTERLCTDAGLSCSRLQTSHAFHSASMDDAARQLAAVLREVELRPPRCPFTSGVTGALITDSEATDPMYWARQLRQPVRFADAVRAAAGDGPVCVIEAGPRETLVALTRQILAGTVTAAAMLPRRDGVGEVEGFLRAMGTLWAAGLDALAAVPRRPAAAAPVSLPGYPFDRRSCWVSPAGPALRRPPVTDFSTTGLDVLLQSQLDLIAAQRDLLAHAAQSARVSGGTESA